MPGAALITSFVAGEWTETDAGAGRFDSRNPYRPDDVVAIAEEAGRATVTSPVEDLDLAGREWTASHPNIRTARLTALADVLASEASALAELIAREVGKPSDEALAEATPAGDVSRYYASLLPTAHGEVFPAAQGNLSVTRRVPVGVVAVVTPFNFPLSIPVWKIAPALACGCAVLWKPALAAIGVARKLMNLFDRVGLGRLVSLVNGGGEVVNDMIGSGVQALTFTGSTLAGRSVALKCLQRGISYQCEMGGSNATIVTRSADLDLAARDCARTTFAYAGQKCTATRRLIVERPVWDDFLARFEAAIGALTVGDPGQHGTVSGPVISASQVENLERLREQACAEYGAPLIQRPGPPGAGYWSPMMVFGPVPAGDRVVDDEVFGPVAFACAVDDFDAAVAAANSGPFGLVTSVYTRDLGEALTSSERANTGLLRVNRMTTGVDLHMPFGGDGASGLGPRELGASAFDFYTTLRTVWFGRG